MISVVIPFFSNVHGLAVLLTLLQQQTRLPHSIVVYDSSESFLGKEITQRYTVNMPILYRQHRGTIYEAWNAGCRSLQTDGVLILNDDVIIPLTFIEYLERAIHAVDAYGFVPEVPSVEHRENVVVGKRFRWVQKPEMRVEKTTWLSGFSFLLTRKAINDVGLFDTKFKIWYGDFDYQERLLTRAGNSHTKGIYKIHGLYVYHYGTTSYKLHAKGVQKQIAMDEEYFNQKYSMYPQYAQTVLKRVIRESSPSLFAKFLRLSLR